MRQPLALRAQRVRRGGELLDQAQLADIETPMMELDRKLEGGRIVLAAERKHFIPTADIGIEAVNHGADAVYIGGPSFGARASADTTALRR